MKTIRLLISIFAIMVGYEANAQYTGSYTHFDLLSGTTLNVNQTASSTNVQVRITASRSLDYVSGSTSYWKPFKMNFKLGVENGTVFPTVYTIETSDFHSTQSSTTKQFSVTLANSSLPHGANLVVHYNNPSNSNTNYTASYGPYVYINNPPPIVLAISNNVITLQYNPVIGSEVNISGSSPSGGNGTYNYEWQLKGEDGIFYTVPSYAITALNSLKISNVLDNSFIRRKLTSGDKTSYSNEILLQRGSRTTFTVQKTAVLNNNGELIGNQMKINLDSVDPNINFVAIAFDNNESIPIEIDQNKEFFLASGYSVGIRSSNGIVASIKATWQTGSDIYTFYY